MLHLHDELTAQIDQLDAQIEAAIAEIDPTPPPDDDHPHRTRLLDLSVPITPPTWDDSGSWG